MRYINVAAASLNQTPLDWDNNRNNLLAAIAAAKAQNVQILCCPELCITGYGCEDAFLSVANTEMALSVLQEILPETQNMAVAVGLPILYRDGLYNTVCLIVSGKMAGFVAKQNLASSGVHYEPRWFKPWPMGVTVEIEIADKTYLLGDLIFELDGIRVGFEICEDAWVANRTGIGLAKRGVDIILNPSASHFAFGKETVRKQFIQEGARAFAVGYVYANLLGNEAGRIIYDGDTVIAASDRFLTVGPRFTFQDCVVTSATLDIEDLRIERGNVVHYTIASHEEGSILKFDMGWEYQNIDTESVGDKDIDENTNDDIHNCQAHTDHKKNQEFTQAVTLGLFDYLRKSLSQGFVLNLSGGSDSAVCACLVYLMVHRALQALGLKGIQKKLAYIEKIKDLDADLSLDNETNTLKSLMPLLLHCLYQRTENNSLITEDAARGLSEALGVHCAVLDIGPIVRDYQKLIEPIVGRRLTFDQDDFALQNIQARVRAPSAWLLANIHQALFLCTSNRSEASVGYTTMDGDSCGGLAPIAGVDKKFLLQWLKWLETEGTSGGISHKTCTIHTTGIPALSILKTITSQVPTAELRPKDQNQSDETDLMPYDWLDSIERLFVRDKRSPVEIFEILQDKYPEIEKKTLKIAIQRFFTLWARNQWKRERLAPSFHLDDESVDPKTWCRYPILSGSFARELAALAKYKE